MIPDFELVAIVPVMIAVLALIKRLSGFDLELRLDRARWGRELTRALAELPENTRANVHALVDDATIFQALENGNLKLEEALPWLDARTSPLTAREVHVLRTLVAGRLPSMQALQETALGQSYVRASRGRGLVRVPRTDMPRVILALLSPDDAHRYEREWKAHLYERVAEGELRGARRDRRRLIRFAVALALAQAIIRVAKRSRS